MLGAPLLIEERPCPDRALPAAVAGLLAVVVGCAQPDAAAPVEEAPSLVAVAAPQGQALPPVTPPDGVLPPAVIPGPGGAAAPVMEDGAQGSPGSGGVARLPERSVTPLAELDTAELARFVEALDLTPQERVWERVAWARDLASAQAVAEESGRPIFLFSMWGQLDGRC